MHTSLFTYQYLWTISVCKSLQGIFAFRLIGNDLKCLSFWVKDQNMCIHECGKFIYWEKLWFSSNPGLWHVQSHQLLCCGWKEPAGQSCSATTVRDYSPWPLLPPLPNMGNCTELKYGLTHPDVQNEYGWSFQSFNRDSHTRPEAPTGSVCWIRLPACIYINTPQFSQILILSLLICLLNTSLSMSKHLINWHLKPWVMPE